MQSSRIKTSLVAFALSISGVAFDWYINPCAAGTKYIRFTLTLVLLEPLKACIRSMEISQNSTK